MRLPVHEVLDQRDGQGEADVRALGNEQGRPAGDVQVQPVCIVNKKVNTPTTTDGLPVQPGGLTFRIPAKSKSLR